MGKLFIALSSFVLAVSAFASAPKGKAPEVGTTHNDLATMMEGFIDANKQYTKKSRIYFNDSAMSVAVNYLHASTVDLDRTTYYDEDYNEGGALLMGDYNGTFSHINSGYATNTSGILEHYRGTSVADADGKLFSERNTNYTVYSTCNEYFDVLGGLIAQVRAGSSSDWTYADGVYTHETVAHLATNEKGEYNDILLKKFQYFAAPMLLPNASGAGNFLTFSSIKVENKADYLSIKLMLSSGNQGLTTTPVENGEVMLSEARVYSGLHFFAPYHATINDKFVEANNIKPLESTDNAHFVFNLNDGDALKVFKGIDLLGYYYYDSELKQEVLISETYTAKASQELKVYLNASDHMFTEILSGDIVVYFDCNWSSILYVGMGINGIWGEAVKVENDENGTYRYSITSSTSTTSLNCYFEDYQDNVSDNKAYYHPEGGEKWDTQFSDINIGDVILLPGHMYKISNISYSYGWNNNEHKWFNYSFSEIA